MVEISPAQPAIGIVVIGRNELPRLGPCLKSVLATGRPAIYVDSGSVDDSVAQARQLGVTVLVLDPGRPFSAARARNEGFSALTQAVPSIEFVQFIDGDCVLVDGWLEAGELALREDGRRAVVTGWLSERNAKLSRYNQLCSLEWRSPAGDLRDFGALGGIMLVRSDVFRRLDGFNERVIAGEDSEFGVRVGLSGGIVTKIPASMATHDADIHRFAQWWRRAVRGGHAIGQRYSLHGGGPVRDCARERRSVLLWGFALPATILALAAPTRGASLILLAAYGALGWRIFRYRRSLGDDVEESSLYARFVVLGKFAEAWGLLRFHLNRMAGRFRLIEYK